MERSEAEQEARIMLDRFMERHVKLEGFLLRRFEEVHGIYALGEAPQVIRLRVGSLCS